MRIPRWTCPGCPQAPEIVNECKRHLDDNEMQTIHKNDDYLGHVIRMWRLKRRPLRHVRQMPSTDSTTNKLDRIQINVTNVKRIETLGSNFGRDVVPPNLKIWKDQPSTFETLNKQAMNSLNTLKTVLFSDPIFALPHSTDNKADDIDTCDFQIECALLIRNPDKTPKLFGYWARSQMTQSLSKIRRIEIILQKYG